MTTGTRGSTPDTEYGVCACSHGKSDHDLSAEHPACFECPYTQSHHEYVGEDDE